MEIEIPEQLTQHSETELLDSYNNDVPDWLDNYISKMNHKVLKYMDNIFENSQQNQQLTASQTLIEYQSLKCDETSTINEKNESQELKNTFEINNEKIEQEETLASIDNANKQESSDNNQIYLHCQEKCETFVNYTSTEDEIQTKEEYEHKIKDETEHLQEENDNSYYKNTNEKQSTCDSISQEIIEKQETDLNYNDVNQENHQIQNDKFLETENKNVIDDDSEEEDNIENDMHQVNYYEQEDENTTTNNTHSKENEEEENQEEQNNKQIDDENEDFQNESQQQFDYIFHQQKQEFLQEGEDINQSDQYQNNEEETEKNEQYENDQVEDNKSEEENYEYRNNQNENQQNEDGEEEEQQQYDTRDDFEHDERFDNQQNSKENDNKEEDSDSNKENEFNQQNSQNSKIDFTQTQNLASFFSNDFKQNLQNKEEQQSLSQSSLENLKSRIDVNLSKGMLSQQIHQQIEKFSQVIKETDQYLDNLLENLLTEKKKLLMEKTMNNQSEENINNSNNEIVSMSCTVQRDQNQENIDPQKEEEQHKSNANVNALSSVNKEVLGKQKENSPTKKQVINGNNTQYHQINLKTTKQLLQNKSLRGSQKQIQNLLKIIQGYDKKGTATNNEEQESNSSSSQQNQQQSQQNQQETEEKETTSQRSRLQEFYDQKQKENLQLQQQKQYLQQQLQQQQQQQNQKLNSIPLNQKNINKLYRLPKLYQDKEIDINNFVEVSKDAIKYGIVLPGYIIEEDYEVFNKSNENLVLKVVVLCHNAEFDDYDEYIYSIRKINVFDYNEKFFILLPPQSSMKFKIALKVPNIRQETSLKGSVTVTLQGFEDSLLQIPITSYVQIPALVCPKELYIPNARCQVINLAVKNGKKSDCKIPLKNNSNFPINLEFEVLNPFENMDYDDNNNQISASQKQCEIVVYPATATLQSNGIMILNLIVKQLQSLDKQTYIKRILLAKFKNSSLITSFPLQFEIY